MLETRDGCEVSLYTRVIPLVGSHCSVIYSLMDGIYGGPGECISYRVVLVLDVASMVALESASATGLSLPWMWHLWWPWRVHQLRGCPCPGCSIYGGPGECISFRVVHSGDTTDVRNKLRDVGDVRCCRSDHGLEISGRSTAP